MLRDVRHTISDGLLGFATSTGDGLHVKIGVSPITADTPIVITGSMTAARIKEALGLSPLADAAMTSVQFGANRLFCITWAELEGLLAKKADLGSDGKVVTAQIPDLFVVGGTEPEKGPVLWFDTSGGQAAANAMLELAEDSGASTVTAEVERKTYSVRNATVNQVPTTGGYNFDLL